MEVVSNNYMPGDPRLVQQLVYELKSQGIFDQFRKECISDVDTKPAYQNLSQRVEGSVSSFLNLQTWRPDMNKNQVREQLRKNIYESGFLETGVERIVDQVVNPKINTVFLPQVEDVVYRYLGIEKPNRHIRKELKIDVSDLLPTDLEAVSPESDHTKDDSSNLNDSVNLDAKLEEDESPPFEPLDLQKNDTHHEENSVDSHLSGFSGLQSHDSNPSQEINISQVDSLNQDSQVSRNSSESHLSIITSDYNTKMDVCEDSTSKVIKSSDLDLKTENSSEIPTNVDKCSVHNEAEITKVEEKMEVDKIEDKPQLDEKVDNKSEHEKVVVEKKIDDKKRDDKKYDKKSDEKKSRSSDKHSSRDRKDDKKDDKYKKSSSSRDKDKSSSRHSSSSTSKDKDRKEKDRKEAKTSSSSSKDKEKDKEKVDREKSSKEKDKSEKDKEKSKSSSNSNSGSKCSSSKEKSSSSRRESSSKDKDKQRSSSSSTSKDVKSKSNHSDSKSRSSSTDKYKKDDKSSHNGKYSSSNMKKDKDKKRDSKKESKDDHYSSKEKKNDRRSTDRDSNDGQSSRQSQSNFPVTTSSLTQKSNQESSNSNSGSGSGDSGNSDQIEHKTVKSPMKLPDTLENKEVSANDVQMLKYIKPRFASNFQEARILMKVRRQLAKLERQNQLSLAQIEVPVEVAIVNGINHSEKENVKVDNMDVVKVPKSPEQKAVVVLPEQVTPVLQSTELSKENWEALEARLAQEMSTVNYNSYELYDDYDDTSCNAIVISPRKNKINDLKYISVEETTVEVNTCHLGKEKTPEPLQEPVTELFPDKEETPETPVKMATEAAKDKVENERKLVIHLQREIKVKHWEATEQNMPPTTEKADHVMEELIESRKPDVQPVTDDSKIEDEPEKTCDMDGDCCRYLEKPSESGERDLHFLRSYISKFERNIEQSLKASQKKFLPTTKRGRKRKLEENVDVKNNNKAHFEQTTETKKRRRSVALNPPKSVANKEKLCNSTDISPNDSFSLPLSPAESDKSSDKKEEDSPNTVKQKLVSTKVTRRSQRYSSEDLYKPRPIFASTRRSRGAKNPE